MKLCHVVNCINKVRSKNMCRKHRDHYIALENNLNCLQCGIQSIHCKQLCLSCYHKQPIVRKMRSNSSYTWLKKTNLNSYYCNKRRSVKLNSSPKWLTNKQLQEIKDFYINCPKGYVVDHIIPLQNKDVQGLHVPWNLQYLTRSENSSKFNRFDFTYNNDSWRKSLLFIFSA